MIKSQIGTNAGEIWQFLNKNGDKSIVEIAKAMKMKTNDVLIALGWLARENKVFFYEENEGVFVTLIFD